MAYVVSATRTAEPGSFAENALGRAVPVLPRERAVHQTIG